MTAAPAAVGGHVPLLDAELLARLERLQLGTRRRLAGRFVGDHRSNRYGSSLDFVDQREYTPGDDVRRIDHNLFARLDVLAIRLFEAEDDLHVRLLVDTSASMAGPKLRMAATLAAALGFVSLVRRDTVSVHTAPLAGPSPRFVGRSATAPLLAHLSGLDAAGDTLLAAAVADLLVRSSPPGVTIVLSDLLTPDWSDALRRLPTRGGEIVVVHVLSVDDVHPSVIGDVDLVDAETGARVAMSLDRATLDTYEALAEAWIEEVAGRCRRAGAAYLRVDAAQDPSDVLVRAWLDAGVLR